MNKNIYQDRPQLDIDMVSRSYQIFDKTGKITFREQRAIYEFLSREIKNKKVIEAGCGVGWGTHLLSLQNTVIGTDKYLKNITFANEFYSDIMWDVWDITKNPYSPRSDVVVAIEVIEHVENYNEAFFNLIDSCNEVLWMSTPNRNHPELSDVTPGNKYHVHEFTPYEIMNLVKEKGKKVDFLNWETGKSVPVETYESPLLCKIY